MDAAPYRQACDRCHRQKLRCIRDADYSGGACIRCFKAQVRCVSSPSLRLRRGEGRNSQNDSTKGSTRKVTPEPVPEDCLPSSVVLDEGTLHSPTFLEHDPSNEGTTGQSVPDIDISLFNFSWPPNVPTGEATLGMTGLPRGQDGGGFPFENNFGHSNMEVSNIHPSPVSNIRASPPMTLLLTGEASLKPSNLTQAPRNEAWIHSLTQINVDLYLQHAMLERNLTSQHDIDSGVGDLSRNKTPGATSEEGTNQFCIGHTFDLIHRLLQLLDEVSSNTRARLDRGSILLVLSCYHRLVEIYGSFFRSPNWGQASPPELSTHMKHSPFLMGQFELYTNSPLYTPLVVSLADFMLLKCRDAVNKINMLSEQKGPDNDHLRIMGNR